MTLIAQTIYQKAPFIIGDIVFSSRKGDQNTPYPTSIASIQDYVEDLEFKPDEYWQKIYIITDNLCIGLAGKEVEMTHFLEELKLQCRYYDVITFDILISIFERYDLNNLFEKSAFIACLITQVADEWEVKTVTYPKRNWQTVKPYLFEQITLVGSGAHEFISGVMEIGTFIATAPSDTLERAVSANLSYLAYLLTKEVVTLNNLRTYWGAGFETIFFNGKKWQKFDQIAYVIFVSEFDEENNMRTPMPRMVFHYRYHKDVLFYSCIRIDGFQIEEDENTITFISRSGFNNVYVVPPLDYKEQLIEAPESYSFKTDRVAYGFYINTKNNGSFSPSSYIEGGTISVSHEEKTSTSITMSKHFLDDLNKAVRQALV